MSDKLTSHFDTEKPISGTLQTLTCIYYKLLKKYFKEINYTKESPYMNNLSNHMCSYASYFFKNFHHQFLKEDTVNLVPSLLPNLEYNSNTDLGLYRTISIKFAAKETFCMNSVYYNARNKLKIEKFLELFLYFNSKLLRWKETYFEREKTEDFKCRICEKEVQLKFIPMHSYVCYQKVTWKENIKSVNLKFKECITSLNYLLVQYSKVDLEISSPLNVKMLNFDDDFGEKVT